MERESLKQLLSQLHAELADGAAVDGELQALLVKLNKDIVDVINATRIPDDPVYSALSERSIALSAQFAAEHPKLEPALRELAAMLAKIGV
ncbi:MULTISPECIES: DUF4404 family protein [unclassified Undibacterium]|uniref:DUF4404 family protein n=1 Tax=unclassified Undibacterium TaxID=2630295 RepID=UPI002AC9416A|nr:MULTISPECIES: DUF4404 family protein [unclassified Undibacterium]MEB0138602.1 DUF4404 family protein [Undibacterium sp. CCC2.1]MEB0171334.1 DUF4404 family protein [Undibacterium sp. CCC1.1]MEB0175366.1 DUF4404 family protein [Undibacterium sp. CCC3.4]MEB0214530.1 DUF4404 family protein [Undibacterium sp. 5I2]WPX43096.1 DUF4404 family protein [Undibacterium sp. CCC3.4]